MSREPLQKMTLDRFESELIKSGLKPNSARTYRRNVSALLNRGGWDQDPLWQSSLTAATQVVYKKAWNKWLVFKEHGLQLPPRVGVKRLFEVFMMTTVSARTAASVASVLSRVKPWDSIAAIEAAYAAAGVRMRPRFEQAWPHFQRWHEAEGVPAPTPVFAPTFTRFDEMAVQVLMGRGAQPGRLHASSMELHGDPQRLLEHLCVWGTEGPQWAAEHLLARAGDSPWVLCTRPGSLMRIRRSWFMAYADRVDGFPLAQEWGHYNQEKLRVAMQAEPKVAATSKPPRLPYADK